MKDARIQTQRITSLVTRTFVLFEVVPQWVWTFGSNEGCVRVIAADGAAGVVAADGAAGI